MNSLKSLVANEPVRAYGYAVLVPLLALLVALGVITTGLVPLILALAGAVLAVGGVTATEVVRSQVSPVVTVDSDSTVKAAPGADPDPEV